MIYTDKQYQVTAKTVNKFRQEIKKLSQLPKEDNSDHKMLQYHNEALQRKLEELEAEMTEYEQVKSGKVKLTIQSLSELGINLVKARIKEGMDQATLAKHLNFSESQIKFHESEKYSTIAIADLRKVAKILNIKIPNEVLPTDLNGKISKILAKLKRAGLERNFVLSRLVVPDGCSKVTKTPVTELEKYTLGLYTNIRHIFEWTWDELTNSHELKPPVANSANVNFKVEPVNKPKRINIYSKYAHYLTNIVAKSAESLTKREIPTNAIEMRSKILKSYQTINLENTLNFAWDCGVIVLPLKIKDNFHGACMRINSRNVIILNPKKLFVSTWLFDLLHEFYHAGQDPNKEYFDEIMEIVTSQERRTSKEEMCANNFANKVLFDNNENKLAQQCIELANGDLESLEKTILQVGKKHDVMVSALANYIAHKYKSDSRFKYKDLLKVAEKLQQKRSDPYKITRNIFMKRFPFSIEDGIDLNLLLQALEDI